MTRNESNEQAAITDATNKLKSQPVPAGAFPPAFTHPIEYFRLQCLNMANSEDSLRKTPEQMVKDAQIFADFIFKPSSESESKRSTPFLVGEQGVGLEFSSSSHAELSSKVNTATYEAPILALLQKVIIISTGKKGVVIAISQYAYNSPKYLIQHIDSNGKINEEWFFCYSLRFAIA